MEQRLKGKVVLVTGASSGIGRVSALMFAKEGARVAVVADLNTEGGEETADIIKHAKGEAIFIKTDVSKAAEVEAMVNKIVKTYGHLDCAFNNAGVRAPFYPTAEYSEETWDYVVNINLKGVWLCMKYEIPQMLKQGKGVIVNTASAVGLVGMENRSIYTASKHGVVGLTKAAALDYAQANIRINAVCPGVIRTPWAERTLLHSPEAEAQAKTLQPIGRIGTSEEVAEVVVWLCTDAASLVTGHAMAVDGGWVAR